MASEARRRGPVSRDTVHKCPSADGRHLTAKRRRWEKQRGKHRRSYGASEDGRRNVKFLHRAPRLGLLPSVREATLASFDSCVLCIEELVHEVDTHKQLIKLIHLIYELNH